MIALFSRFPPALERSIMVREQLGFALNRAGQRTEALEVLEKVLAEQGPGCGFEADARDAYPGINAVTLLDIRGDEESLRRKDELLPVIRFAVRQRLRGSKAAYWDHATLLELAVLENNENAAFACLADALSSVRDSWEPATTANNLQLILDARQACGTE